MIEKYEAQFSVNSVGETTGDSYRGLFRVRCRLSHRDHLNRDRLRRDLIGTSPEAASDRARSIGEIFSQLSVRVIEAPSWWTNSENGLGLADDNVVAEIYQEALKAEADEVAKVTKKGEEAKADLKTDVKADPAAV